MPSLRRPTGAMAHRLEDHRERDSDALLANRVAAQIAKAFFPVFCDFSGGDSEMNESNRFSVRATTGAGNAGHGNGEVDAGCFARTFRHRTSDRF